MLAPISYTPLTEDEVFEHFKTVAQESRLPLCIYDNPGTTHFTFTPSLIGRLSRLENIIGVKAPATKADEVAAQLDSLRREVPAEFSVGVSVDWHSAEGLLAGADA